MLTLFFLEETVNFNESAFQVCCFDGVTTLSVCLCVCFFMTESQNKQTKKKKFSLMFFFFFVFSCLILILLHLASFLCNYLESWVELEFGASLSGQRDSNMLPCEWPVNTSCSVKPLSLCVQITLRQTGFFTVHLISSNPTIQDTGLSWTDWALK